MFLSLQAKVALGVLLTLISVCLAWASAAGLKRLWVVTGIVALVVAMVGFVAGFSVPLSATYCGPLCGSGVNLDLFTVILATIIGACIHSIPPLRTRRWLRAGLSFVVMGLVIILLGLTFWVA
jgi:hypothetical protein